MDEDGGSIIQYAMESLVKVGACEEDKWPYDEDRVLDKPVKGAYKQAKRFEVQKRDIRRVKFDLDTWRTVLADGYPIVFGTTLFDSFDDCCNPDKYFVVPMPSPDEVVRAEHGGHCMVAVGYSDVDGVFIVRNSWGEDWGDKGYCYMPYNCECVDFRVICVSWGDEKRFLTVSSLSHLLQSTDLMSPEFGADDAWTLQSAVQITDFKDGWVKGGKRQGSKGGKGGGGRKMGSKKGGRSGSAKPMFDNRQCTAHLFPNAVSILNGGKGVPFNTNPYPADSYVGFNSSVAEDAVDYNDELPDDYVDIINEHGGESDEGDEEDEEDDMEDVYLDDDDEVRTGDVTNR